MSTITKIKLKFPKPLDYLRWKRDNRNVRHVSLQDTETNCVYVTVSTSQDEQ